MDHKLVAWLVCGFLAFMLILGVGIYLEDKQEADQMKACVEAGKTWVRDNQWSDYYECK